MQKALCLMFLILFSSIVAHAQAPAGTEGKYVTVYGAPIHYVERGSGPVVVLVHGLADDTGIWQASMEPLSRSFRVIAVDLIGHGRSAKPLLNYRAATFADFLIGFLDTMKIERATLVGNSLGGWVSTLVALREPRRVERLVLVGSVGFAAVEQLTRAPLSGLNSSSLEESRKLLPYAFANQKIATDPATAKALLEQRVVNGDGYTIATFLASFKRKEDVIDGRLGGLKMPVFIIWGEGDRLTPLALARRYVREIRGARLGIIPNCGHMPQYECSAPFNEVLLKFLSGAPPKHPG